MRLKIEWDYWHILLAVVLFSVGITYLLYRGQTIPCPKCETRVEYVCDYCPHCGQQLRIDQVDKPK